MIDDTIPYMNLIEALEDTRSTVNKNIREYELGLRSDKNQYVEDLKNFRHLTREIEYQKHKKD